ncbi:DNA cross-link repair protein pso2/snm1 [Mycena belliarum]|uniref:DNA cross-link repair protein pso2/snm1 n=1 Tax=Mycena belliarum TaxID=1033014 RepID=A0AAD6U5E1_9AGAR|nr:DNA cross-link repair protein pso2/snm1 [Mycena belliae]
MAPQKKGKQLKNAQNKSAVTLHNFFSSPGAGPSKTPLASKLSKQLTPGTSRAKPKPTYDFKDVIVIDSDSDVEVQVVRSAPKKRRRSASSSDVELVGCAPSKRVSAVVSAPPALPRIAPNPMMSFGNPSALLAAPGSSAIPSLSFGPPSALLGGPSISAPTVSDGPLAFGKPTSLLSRRDDVCPPVLMNLEGEDDWGMGDDEMVDSPDNDDGEEVSFELEESAVIQISSCPLCEKALGELSETDRQSHVNACLDAIPGSKPGPSNAFLRPLSSFLVPSAHDTAKSKSGNAFSVLMTSRAEMAVWNEATTCETSRATKTNRRKAPFYKVMQGMPIAVDAFRYGKIPGVTAYFLTHAHSDHYTNLSSSWKHGPIYCSEGTANLIIHMLAVDKKWVHPLPMDVATVVPGTGGVQVTLIEANHCPGSCLFLFEGPQTVDAGDSAFKSPHVGSAKIFRYLHCGDFRASPQHTLHPAVKGKHLDTVYLDTTYLDPKYTFPPQPLVISACAELAKRIAAGKTHDGGAPKVDSWLTPAVDPKGKQKARPERILMVVGTYSVGKERIVKAVAQAVNSKIYCDARKRGILRCQPDPELHALLTADPLAADVHILPLGKISLETLQLYLEQFKGAFTKVVGFRPTGWTYSPPAGAAQPASLAGVIAAAQQRTFTHAHLRAARSTSAALQLFPVPYSEHSSFFELTCFALSLRWGRMIATVNVGSEGSRARMARWVQKWDAERKRRGRDAAVPHRRADYW